MKKVFSLISLSFLAVLSAQGQATFNTRDSININNINASVLLHGDMWWDPTTQVAKCELHQGSGKHIGFASSVWMSGYDGAGQLHVAAQTYRQDGNDYWPGPLDAADTLTYATSTNWAKFWKVSRPEIQLFQTITTHTIINTPPSILTWPGAGSAYATGNMGLALTISPTTVMAPFVDVNGNGIYEPLLGDYPDIKGDQAIWWVFSDNGPTHTQTHGKPLGIEIHAMTYAYARGTAIDNVVFYEFSIINKSHNTYSNFRLGQSADVDLGYYNDDFIGYDSAYRMGVTYSGTPDDGLIAGHPVNSFGTHPPIVGTTMIQMPGDTALSHVPVGSFNRYNNDFSVWGNPSNDTQFNYYMRSANRIGTHITNDYAGPGLPMLAAGTGPATDFFFPGDPSDSAGWSECAMGNIPGDRRFVITSYDFTLLPGATTKWGMALVVTDTTQGGCPGANFHDLESVADTAWNRYWNPPTPIPLAISNANVAGDVIRLYPDPAHSKLNIDAPSGMQADAKIAIYNTIGKQVNVQLTKNNAGAQADIEALPAGIYYMIYKTSTTQQTLRFVKE